VSAARGESLRGPPQRGLERTQYTNKARSSVNVDLYPVILLATEFY
jgi:hypothetical protein